MCQFCHQHGEGKKWYLDARNYSEDLLSDLRRRRFIERFFSSPEHLRSGDDALRRLNRVPPFLTRGLRRKITAKQMDRHFGQVVPIEDVEKILDLATSVVRLECLCRHVFLGTEHRYCYGISAGPQGGELLDIIRGIDPAYLIGPGTGGLEYLSKEKALTLMRENEREGLCHSVWTFITPFIGGLCNCALPGCMALRATLSHRTPVMFRSEFLARIASEACSGCGACLKLCPFGAFFPTGRKEKARIDPMKCYGCGICRSVCTRQAIRLVDRAAVEETASLWLGR